MAIYHLSASIIKRSAGRSVTAAAAYRAAAKIEDLKTGIIHDYGRKQGVDYSEMISPLSPNSNSTNQWLTNRAELWNKIELIEKRKDAQLAREVTIAIPKELSKPDQIALVREYVNTNYVAAGMIADLNLHHLGGDNPHAHILLTMRNLQTSPGGIVEFGLKNTDWNSKELLLAQRKSWEEITNQYLAARSLDTRIDCRSLEEQGSPYIPQIHVGVHAMAMKRKGIKTDRGDEFEQIEAANNDIRALLEETYQQEYTEPKTEIIEEYKDILPEQDRELGELVNALIPLKYKQYYRCEEGYGFKRGDENHIQIYVHPSNAKILEFTRENDKWNTNIINPNNAKYRQAYYSTEYINEIINHFEKCIRYPDEFEDRKLKKDKIEEKYKHERPYINRKFYPTHRQQKLQEIKPLEDIIDRYYQEYRFARRDVSSEIETLRSSLLYFDQDVIRPLHPNYDSKLVKIQLDNNKYEYRPNPNYGSHRLHPSYKIKEYLYQVYLDYDSKFKKKVEDNIREFRPNPNGRYLHNYIQSTNEDRQLESQRLINGFSSQTLWMKNLATEIESEIIKVRTYTEIESTRQKAEIAEKAAAIEIESLPPRPQPKVTHSRPPDRKPISEGNPRVHLRAMANATRKPTVDLTNDRDLPVETPPINPIPVIEQPEPTIVKSPTPDKITIQVEETPPPELEGHKLIMWKIKQQNEEFAKEYLRKKAEEKKVNPKPQTTKKPNRGFSL